MNQSQDPRATIDNSPMSRVQIVVVSIMVMLCALDGFDMLSISFAAPGIAEEWGVDQQVLGLVLSMELLGMAIGSIAIGNMADRYGRRMAILVCLLGMAIGMTMVAAAEGLLSLSVWRIVTGIGIGGILASVNAMAAEFSNLSVRHMSCSLAVLGVPLGGALGGLVAAQLLNYFDWRSVFYFGALITALSIPLVIFCVPESVYWLAQKQPKNALERINRTLARMRFNAVSTLPAAVDTGKNINPLKEIFAPSMRRVTLLVTTLYFAHVLTLYFLMKWTPKIVVDMGFTASAAGTVLVWVNVGGILGSTVFALAVDRIGLRRLMSIVLLASAVSVAAFGQLPADLTRLGAICALAGFFAMGAMSGLYATLAHVFPTPVRAVGTGFGIGVGRGGSIVSPILAGVLFSAGFGLPAVAALMALGSVLSLLVLFVLPLHRGGAVLPGPA